MLELNDLSAYRHDLSLVLGDGDLLDADAFYGTALGVSEAYFFFRPNHLVGSGLEIAGAGRRRRLPLALGARFGVIVVRLSVMAIELLLLFRSQRHVRFDVWRRAHEILVVGQMELVPRDARCAQRDVGLLAAQQTDLDSNPLRAVGSAIEEHVSDRSDLLPVAVSNGGTP